MPLNYHTKLYNLLYNLYTKTHRGYEALSYHSTSVFQIQKGNEYIKTLISNGSHGAIGKVGSVELLALKHYLKKRNELNRQLIWEKHKKELYINAGVFPPNYDVFDRWSEFFINTLKDMTVVGVWFHIGESELIKKYCRRAKLVPIRSFEPYYSEKPWTILLEGKKVLVMHPFIDSITKQFNRRSEVWAGIPDILTDFELLTIKVPLSDGRVKSTFTDWFETLKFLKEKMEKIEFDIALVGAGAYSLPLVVHASKIGKIGIHLGGSLQILFGIKGRRWDRHPVISKFYNSAWCRPNVFETPKGNFNPEDGGYW